MTIIRTFYHEFQIEFPHLIFKSKNNVKQTIKDVPTLEHVKKAMNFANIKYKAIIVLMLSSGMGKGEITSLNVNDFLNSIKEYLNAPIDEPFNINQLLNLPINHDAVIIPTWNIQRIKTNHNYTTFSSPESYNYIIDYLKQYPPQSLEDPLFRTKSKRLKESAFVHYFSRINRRCEFGNYDRQAFLDPMHSENYLQLHL